MEHRCLEPLDGWKWELLRQAGLQSGKLWDEGLERCTGLKTKRSRCEGCNSATHLNPPKASDSVACPHSGCSEHTWLKDQ